jgi:hypothetical protein
MRRHQRLFVAAKVACALLVAQSATAAVVWRADFEDRSLAAFQQKLFDRHITLVAAPGRPGTTAARFELHAEDKWRNGLRRCELGYVPNRSGLEGSEHYYAWSVFVPASGGAGRGGHEDKIAYWESDQLYRISLRFALQADRLTFSVSMPTPTGKDAGKLWTGPFAPDRWHELVLRVLWSSTPSAGLVELWVDGAKVVESLRVQTLHKEGGKVYFPFLHTGILHEDMDTPPESLLVDDFVDATTFMEATQGRGAGAPAPSAPGDPPGRDGGLGDGGTPTRGSDGATPTGSADAVASNAAASLRDGPDAALTMAPGPPGAGTSARDALEAGAPSESSPIAPASSRPGPMAGTTVDRGDAPAGTSGGCSLAAAGGPSSASSVVGVIAMALFLLALRADRICSQRAPHAGSGRRHPA